MRRSSPPVRPLHNAVMRKSPEQVRELLESRIDPNVTDDRDGFTPLVLGLNHNQEEHTKALLEYKADPLHRVKEKREVFLWATSPKMLSIVLDAEIKLDLSQALLTHIISCLRNSLHCPDERVLLAHSLIANHGNLSFDGVKFCQILMTSGSQDLEVGFFAVVMFMLKHLPKTDEYKPFKEHAGRLSALYKQCSPLEVCSLFVGDNPASIICSYDNPNDRYYECFFAEKKIITVEDVESKTRRQPTTPASPSEATVQNISSLSI